METSGILNIPPKELNDFLDKEFNKYLLVDVRENSELEIANFPYPVLHLPLSLSEKWIDDIDNLLPLNKIIVVICHSGIRSYNFATWLIDQRKDYKVLNLLGGIDAWSVEIDPSIARY